MRFVSGAICVPLMTASLLAIGSAAHAQETAAAEPDDTQSGYREGTGFGGPESVSRQLAQQDQSREFIYQWDAFDRAFAGYFDWKRELNDEFGLAFGFQYYLLPQYATSSQANNDALGSIFRFHGTWTLFGHDGIDPGRIEWRVENRTDVWGRQSPNDLSGAVGAGPLNTGFAYSSSFSTDLAVLNWTQGFRNSTAGYAAGRLAFDVYLDAMPFQTFSRGFVNRAFLVNPTIATTGIGALGAVAKGMINDQFWVGGQIHDGNAASGSFDWDTVREGEWLSAIEVGWTPAFADRKQKMVQFTYWHKDARTLAGVPSGRGWVVSAAWKNNRTYFPFMRFGHSDGGAGVPAESALSAGVEITREKDEIWSIGAGWAKPSEKTFGPGLRDEWVFETSYKFQLSKNLSLTPDVQLLFNPANNPGRSSVVVAGVRFILFL